MATIADRFRKLFGRSVTSDGSDLPANTSTEIHPPKRFGDLRGRFIGGGSGRHETVRKCRDMYKSDPRIEGVLRMLARDTVRAGFTLTIKDGPLAERAQEVTDALLKRVDLQSPLSDWICLAARDGDDFLEIGVSAEGEIVQVTRKPPLEMVKLSDKYGRFEDPAKAYAWSDEINISMGRLGEGAVYFPDFLIVHAPWNHDSEKRYGTPEFASAKGTWRKVIEGELDLAIRRKTRAGITRVHVLENASEADIETYKRVNQEVLGDRSLAVADYFINGGRIDQLSGDSNLGEIGDVEHHIQTLFASSPVPIELLAYGSNLNRDVLGDKKEQYEETLTDTRKWAAARIIKPIIERQWLLAGILPESVEYEIIWPAKRAIKPDDLVRLLDAALKAKELGWGDEQIMALLEPFLPEFFDQVLVTSQPKSSAAVPSTEQRLSLVLRGINNLLERAEMDAGDNR